MDWTDILDREIREKDDIKNIKILSMESMSRHTSFHIGGPARRMAFPANTRELSELVKLGYEIQARPVVIGNGTNLLCPDGILNRLVINTSNMRRIEIKNIENIENSGACENDGGLIISADAGVSLRRLAEFACKKSQTGLEFAHGIPGSLGGAVCMNAGAYDGEMARVLYQAEIFFPDENKIKILELKDLKLSYRHSVLTEQPDAVVLSADVKLQAGDESKIREKTRDFMERRKKSQPLDMPSAGSAFKRPTGYYAGTLIDQCGLKGFQIGGARVSDKHAGFIVNQGGATFQDVYSLIQEVRRRVWEEKGVELEPEIRIINE